MPSGMGQWGTEQPGVRALRIGEWGHRLELRGTDTDGPGGGGGRGGGVGGSFSRGSVFVELWDIPD